MMDITLPLTVLEKTAGAAKTLSRSSDKTNALVNLLKIEMQTNLGLLNKALEKEKTTKHGNAKIGETHNDPEPEPSEPAFVDLLLQVVSFGNLYIALTCTDEASNLRRQLQKETNTSKKDGTSFTYENLGIRILRKFQLLKALARFQTERPRLVQKFMTATRYHRRLNSLKNDVEQMASFVNTLSPVKWYQCLW